MCTKNINIKKDQEDSFNNKDLIVSSTIFLYTEYVLRHIKNKYYFALSQIEYGFCIYEAELIDIFMLIYYNEILQNRINKNNRYLSICNFIQSFTRIKINNFKKKYKKIMEEKYQTEDIYSIYNTARIYILPDIDFKFLLSISLRYGVFANRVFEFQKKDYLKINKNNILYYSEPLFPTLKKLNKLYKPYILISSLTENTFELLQFSINTQSKEYDINEASHIINIFSSIHNINNIYKSDHPSKIINNNFLESIIQCSIKRIAYSEFRNKLVCLLIWDNIKYKTKPEEFNFKFYGDLLPIDIKFVFDPENKLDLSGIPKGSDKYKEILSIRKEMTVTLQQEFKNIKKRRDEHENKKREFEKKYQSMRINNPLEYKIKFDHKFSKDEILISYIEFYLKRIYIRAIEDIKFNELFNKPPLNFIKEKTKKNEINNESDYDCETSHNKTCCHWDTCKSNYRRLYRATADSIASCKIITADQVKSLDQIYDDLPS